MHLTSTLVSQLFIPTPSARFHFVHFICFIIQQDVFMHLTSTLVSQLFIPTPSARFHFVQNLNILHKKYKISKFRFRQ